MPKHFTPSFGLVYFHIALLKVDQTAWTMSHCDNGCLFGALLPKMSADQEGKKQTWLIDWLGPKMEIHPPQLAFSQQVKTSHKQP